MNGDGRLWNDLREWPGLKVVHGESSEEPQEPCRSRRMLVSKP
jgi:hypothetical protein